MALQKTGAYQLKTLPSGNSITYGTTSALDLQNFDTFVLPEPNVLLSSAEKAAVMNFVKNGGGLSWSPTTPAPTATTTATTRSR